MKKLTIGLIGNPNSGKTTLFNQLTGARQRVGNWAGVTVERKEGQFSTTDHQVTLVDLPGTYVTILASEDRSKQLRQPRPSVWEHLKQEPKQAAPKAPAHKKREPER